ncbi:MAG: hypothetical protein ACKV2V_20185, partial [Blastocatellia bacterium]
AHTRADNQNFRMQFPCHGFPLCDPVRIMTAQYHLFLRLNNGNIETVTASVNGCPRNEYFLRTRHAPPLHPDPSFFAASASR